MRTQEIGSRSAYCWHSGNGIPNGAAGPSVLGHHETSVRPGVRPFQRVSLIASQTLALHCGSLECENGHSAQCISHHVEAVANNSLSNPLHEFLIAPTAKPLDLALSEGWVPALNEQAPNLSDCEAYIRQQRNALGASLP